MRRFFRWVFRLGWNAVAVELDLERREVEPPAKRAAREVRRRG